jgi:hypothetical protein
MYEITYWTRDGSRSGREQDQVPDACVWQDANALTADDTTDRFPVAMAVPLDSAAKAVRYGYDGRWHDRAPWPASPSR